MKNLTISTAVPRALLEMTQELAEPHDYYRGLRAASPVLPDDILLFGRNGRELGPFPHSHHRFVLISALEGRGTVVVDQTAHELRPTRCLLIFPYQFHHYADVEAGSLCWLFTTFELGTEAALEPLRGMTRKLPATGLGDLLLACRAFRARRRSASPESGELRLRIGLVLTALLRARAGSVPVQPPRFAAKTADTELLERVGRHVFAHLREPISVPGLARAIRMSESHLRQQLRARYGLSPHGYIRQIKMLQAMRLMRAGERTLSEIADALGYSSLFAFSRTFKDETGVSPRRFRREG
ncbi:MAG TPA: AraC family transcriptional regulator [Polyangiaceae bacterium]|nr:AraC family transcriptional regulator [Polyangiaceae bacterium]